MEMIELLRVCRAHEAAALVRRTADEECDNICRLSTYFLGCVLTDWQVAVMLARAHPHSAHIMVRRIPSTINVITILLLLHAHQMLDLKYHQRESIDHLSQPYACCMVCCILYACLVRSRGVQSFNVGYWRPSSQPLVSCCRASLRPLSTRTQWKKRS